jgi:hypothetical protein
MSYNNINNKACGYVENYPDSLYLSQKSTPKPVDKIVDKQPLPVEEMWITRELSTVPGYPHNSPQVYPQILPLLSTGLSTDRIVELA